MDGLTAEGPGRGATRGVEVGGQVLGPRGIRPPEDLPSRAARGRGAPEGGRCSSHCSRWGGLDPGTRVPCCLPPSCKVGPEGASLARTPGGAGPKALPGMPGSQGPAGRLEGEVRPRGRGAQGSGGWGAGAPLCCSPDLAFGALPGVSPGSGPLPARLVLSVARTSCLHTPELLGPLPQKPPDPECVKATDVVLKFLVATFKKKVKRSQ